ncbi:MAG: tetratricopeptide repeat protein, partial [Vicinamibacterales bacterium]
ALGLATAARNREYGSALSLAETTFERWPTPETRHMYASELSLAGREEEALEELKASVGGFPRANYNLGIALFRQKAYPEAIAAFDAFVKAYPSLLEVVEARVLTGRSHAELGHWTEAAQAYDDALRMRPSRREIHGLLADALVQLDRDEEAVPHYRTFLDAFPDDTGALGTLGVLLMERERFKEAIPVFRRVVDIDPKNAIARRNLATALLAESDAAGAVEQARQAASLSPDDALSLDLLGLALIERGLPSEAVLAFRRANQLAPADPVIREHLGAAEALVAAGGQRPPAGR